MNGLANWIRGHQITSFFAITFAISWGLGFSWSAVQHEQYLFLPLAFIAACGPALAGILISAVANVQPKEESRKVSWIAFLVALAVSALVALAFNVFINDVQLSPALVILIIIAVVPVAYVISASYSRIPAVRNYVSSLTRLRGVWGWSFLALVMLPALILLSVPISNILDGQPIAENSFPDLSLTLIGLIAIKFLYQLFFFNATGEETGWRGFALPRLQVRTSPLVAALSIALFWAPWHFFVWQAEGKPVSTLQFWVEMYTGHILFSVFLVWICNRAGGSILVAGIAHASANTAFAFAALRHLRGVNVIWFVGALVLVLIDRMWKRLPDDHPVVYKSPDRLPSNSLERTPPRSTTP
jgi:membrane protease YdiL (CAAX protease family)